MTDPVADAAPTATSWRVANLVLMALALALVATTVVLFTRDESAAAGDSRAKRLSREYQQVTAAARVETLAFLTVDYQHMDPLIAKVLAGATGDFKEQYAQARTNLKSSARKSQAISTGTVLSIGVGDIDEQQAVVFVAADSQVTNKSTQGKPEPHYYRLKLSMTRQGDTWLTSDLQFVG